MIIIQKCYLNYLLPFIVSNDFSNIFSNRNEYKNVNK